MATSAQAPSILDRWEAVVAKKITRGDIPFLGLYTDVFHENARAHLKTLISRHPRPVDGFITGLRKWPALFASYLTVHVVEGYGTDAGLQVYPYIEQAVTGGIRQLDATDRGVVWKAYRLACTRLGLSVSGRQSGNNFMVEEYLRQAGVPLAYADDLAERMVRYVRDAGLPDDDDMVALRLWQRGLVGRLGLPFPVRARRPLEQDDTGFYTRLFAKAVRNPQDPEVQRFAFGRELAAGLEKRGARAQGKHKRLSIPQLLWRDEFLGIELPATDGAAWFVDTGESRHRYEGLAESRFVPLDGALPASICVETDKGVVVLKERLWEEGGANRVLIFDGRGLFVAGAKLGEAEPVALEPGTFQLVTRFLPTGLGDDAVRVSADPEIYAYALSLAPGQRMVLRRGPAEVILQADTKPLALLEGQAIRGIRGREILLSAGLVLRAVIPPDFAFQATEFDAQISFLPQGETISQRYRADDLAAGIDLNAVVGSWTAGLGSLVVEIRRGDVARPLARATAYVWVGLERVVDRCRFVCSRLPANLDKETSENVFVDAPKQVITYRDDSNRFFRTAFELGTRGQLTLTWAVPGVFLFVKDYSGGDVVERPVRKGGLLSISSTSRQVLEVYSSANGTLELGTYHEAVEFERIGMRRLHLPALVDHLRPGADELLFWQQGCTQPERLVRLVIPREVLKFSVRREHATVHVDFEINAQVAALRLSGSELLSGQEIDAEIRPYEAVAREDSARLGWVFESRDGAAWKYTLFLPIERWSHGIWLVTLHAAVGGSWGRLTNKRGDLFYVGLLVSPSCTPASRHDATVWLEELPLEHRLEVLARLHELILVCHAPESWPDVKWVLEYWEQLARELAPQGGGVLRDLMALAAKSPEVGSSSSWIPLRSLMAFAPWILARPASDYSPIPAGHGPVARVATLLPQLAESPVTMYREGILDQVTAVAFLNIGDMQRGAEPRDFSTKRLCLALAASDLSGRMRLLRQEDWQPGLGDFLGALHYHYALANLRERYRLSLGGNDIRRTHALFLANAFSDQDLADFCSGVPAHLCGRHGALGLLHGCGEECRTEEAIQLEENLEALVRFLSLVAQVCRWEPRHRGTLRRFQTVLGAVDRDQRDIVQPTLAYLFYLGEEILAYYLLLWELAFFAEE